MSRDMAQLGERMRAARVLAGLDQIEMAEQLGVHRNAVSAWERGVNEPGALRLTRWAEITDRSLDWLATGREAVA